jgi:integrase/recombinase XerD
LRGHSPKAHSEIGLTAVIRDTARLWRKHELGYDQTKYVVEHVRRQLALAPPRGAGEASIVSIASRSSA